MKAYVLNTDPIARIKGFGCFHIFFLVIFSILVVPVCTASGVPELRLSTSSLIFSPDDKYIAFAYAESGPVRTINLETGLISNIFPVEAEVTDINFSDDGVHIAAGIQTSYGPLEGIIRVWDTETANLLGLNHAASVMFVHFQEDPLMISYEHFGGVQDWNLRKGIVIDSPQKPFDISHSSTLPKSSLSVNENRGIIADCLREEGSSISIKDISTSETLLEISEPGSIRSLFFSDSGNLLAAIISDEVSTIRLWETDTWTELYPLVIDKRVIEGSLNSDGTLLALHLHPDTLKIWDLDSLDVVLSISVRLPEEKLYKAAEQGDLELVKAIISKDINIDLTVGGVSTPTALIIAIQKGHTEVIKVLISAGTDINARFWNYGRTSLWHAISSNNLEITKALIDSGGDLQVTFYERGETYLMVAAQLSTPDMVSLLIDAGAEINTQTNPGHTALAYAAMYGRLEIAEVLLENGADPDIQNEKGVTALMIAIQSGQKELSNLLIKAGADVNIKDNEGNTPLSLLAETRAEQNEINSVKIVDAQWRESAEKVVVQMENLDFSSLTETYENVLWDRFASKPEGNQFTTISNQDWYEKWIYYKEKLIEKADAKGYSGNLLRKCIDTIDPPPDNRIALLPVGAYLARRGSENVWIIICKWEHAPSYIEEENRWEFNSLGHIRGWAIQEKDQRQITFFTCM